MGFLFGSPKAPAPPPPPPSAPTLSTPSIAEQGAMERQRLAAADGQGFDGTDVTGGQGVTGSTRTTANAGAGVSPGGTTATKALLGG